MELLGENLANTRRKRAEPPPLSLLVNVTLQCLKGLFALHQAGVVHSDVKPSNFAFRTDNGDYTVVTLDFGLSEFPQENPEVTAFRTALQRNPRYLSLAVHSTNTWTQKDDLLSLVYTISDFWRDELPWDGRTTNRLVLEVKDGYDLHSLLPPEMQFYVDIIGESDELIIQRFEEFSGRIGRNVEEELRYILDPPDPKKVPKMVNYVFEGERPKRSKRQLSA
jgi:tau tubulin kinase